MQSYNPIYRRYIDESKTTTPAKMLRGKFYLIKQYEYVDGTKGNYTPNTSPIIYTLFTSKAKDIVHAVKVSNIHPQLIKRFFGKFVNEDEEKLELRGGAKAFDWLNEIGAKPVLFDNSFEFINLNKPEDWSGLKGSH